MLCTAILTFKLDQIVFLYDHKIKFRKENMHNNGNSRQMTRHVKTIFGTFIKQDGV